MFLLIRQPYFKTQRTPFIVPLSMALLFHGNPASAGNSMTFSVLTDTIKETPLSCKYMQHKITFYNELSLYRSDSSCVLVTFLGAFAKLRKTTICFVISARVSVRIEQLGYHWTDFHETCYLRTFLKSV